MSIYNKEYTGKLILENTNKKKKKEDIKTIILLILAIIFAIPLAIIAWIGIILGISIDTATDNSKQIKKKLLEDKKVVKSILDLSKKCQNYIYDNVPDNTNKQKYFKKYPLSESSIEVKSNKIINKNSDIRIFVNILYLDLLKIRKDTNADAKDYYYDEWYKDHEDIVKLSDEIENTIIDLNKSLHDDKIGKILEIEYDNVFGYHQFYDYDKINVYLSIKVKSLIDLAKTMNKEYKDE